MVVENERLKYEAGIAQAGAMLICFARIIARILAFQYSHVLLNGAPFPPWNKLALTDAKPQIIPVASLQPLAEDECIIAGLDPYGEAIALSA